MTRLRRVLIVEDSGAARAFVRAILEEEGTRARLGPSEVVEASSGFEAMRLLPRGPYDLIITDINMGDINGLELIRFIRKSDQHGATPLIIISTLGSERDIDRGMALGANAYVPKPFTAESFVSACEKVLAGEPR